MELISKGAFSCSLWAFALIFQSNLSTSYAEMLAILNYESKAPESLEALQLQGGSQDRIEGIAIIELDALSADFGRILLDIPVSPDFVLHHILLNPIS